MAKNNENIATIHERMAVCVKLFGEGKNTVFADKLGVSEGNIRGYIKGVVPKADVLEKIVRTYDVSPKWLLTGEGEINQIKTEKNSDSSEISSSISFDPSIGSPFYDVDFIGGFDEIFNSQTAVPACNIVVPGFEKASLWCNVTGHSMEPKICHGDIIALHECTVQDIQYGEIYAVVLDSFRTIKILRKGTTSDVMRYVPINPDFDDQEFPVSRILRIFEVLGSIAKFF